MVSRMASKIVLGTGYLAGLATVLILLLVCYSLKEGAFIRIELLYDKLKGATFFWVKALITISALIFSAILTYFLILHTTYAYMQDVRAVSILQTPEWVPMSIVVLGCAVLTLQLAIFTFTKFKNLP